VGEAWNGASRVAHAEDDRFVVDVETAIRARLSSGKLSLRAVAGDLQLPPRTLQRRLGEGEQSYSALVRDIRCNAACLMLKDETMSIAQIGVRLGFEDPSNFSRAFRKWTGVSPQRWRHNFKEGHVPRRRV
jgi:AraC-like DNA-binding protein